MRLFNFFTSWCISCYSAKHLVKLYFLTFALKNSIEKLLSRNKNLFFVTQKHFILCPPYFETCLLCHLFLQLLYPWILWIWLHTLFRHLSLESMRCVLGFIKRHWWINFTIGIESIWAFLGSWPSRLYWTFSALRDIHITLMFTLFERFWLSIGVCYFNWLNRNGVAFWKVLYL